MPAKAAEQIRRQFNETQGREPTDEEVQLLLTELHVPTGADVREWFKDTLPPKSPQPTAEACQRLATNIWDAARVTSNRRRNPKKVPARPEDIVRPDLILDRPLPGWLQTAIRLFAPSSEARDVAARGKARGKRFKDVSQVWLEDALRREVHEAVQQVSAAVAKWESYKGEGELGEAAQTLRLAAAAIGLPAPQPGSGRTEEERNEVAREIAPLIEATLRETGYRKKVSVKSISSFTVEIGARAIGHLYGVPVTKRHVFEALRQRRRRGNVKRRGKDKS
jgi:hypothetical protein